MTIGVNVKHSFLMLIFILWILIVFIYDIKNNILGFVSGFELLRVILPAHRFPFELGFKIGQNWTHTIKIDCFSSTLSHFNIIFSIISDIKIRFIYWLIFYVLVKEFYAFGGNSGRFMSERTNFLSFGLFFRFQLFKIMLIAAILRDQGFFLSFVKGITFLFIWESLLLLTIFFNNIWLDQAELLFWIWTNLLICCQKVV